MLVNISANQVHKHILDPIGRRMDSKGFSSIFLIGLMEMLYFKEQFHADLFLSFPIRAVNPSRFTQELAPFFISTDRTADFYTATGISKEGEVYLQACISNGRIPSALCELYRNKPSVGDITETSFYRYHSLTQSANRDESLLDFFSDPFFRSVGFVNVSSYSLDEIDKSDCIKQIADCVDELYVFAYSLELDGNTYYVKYLHWY